MVCYLMRQRNKVYTRIMFAPLRQLFRSGKRAPNAAVPAGERLYILGDIHGRLDLFEELILAIEADDRSGTPAQTTIILLGDLVDRGPQSAGVISRARQLQAQRPARILIGNHEEMFLESFHDTNMLRHFLRHGGRETILSYGLDEQRYNDCSLEELQEIMHEIVPEADRAFLRSFEELIQIGDYAFVHAGINPQVPLEEQRRHDMLWIREPFLRYGQPHSHVIVHGHTICEHIDEHSNRIGIDTGAYRFGRLTALVLEGETRRYIQAVAGDAGHLIEHKETAT